VLPATADEVIELPLFVERCPPQGINQLYSHDVRCLFI
jgi:hypothetical protein